MSRKLPNQHYKDAVNLLRHGYYDEDRERYVGKFAAGFEARDGFNLREIDDWTPQQKAQVTRLYNQVEKLMARPFAIVRSRKPENLERVQQAAQHQQHPKELKVAFVPVARPGEKTDVRITKPTLKYPEGRVIIRERGVKREPVMFEDAGLDPTDLEDNVEGSVAALVEMYPGKLYVPLAGEYELRQGQASNAAALAGQIAALMNQYSDDNGHDEDDSNSHHWKNWLVGVAVYDFRTIKEFQAYRRDKIATAKKLQKQRRRDRYAFRKKYGPRKQKRGRPQ